MLICASVMRDMTSRDAFSILALFSVYNPVKSERNISAIADTESEARQRIQKAEGLVRSLSTRVLCYCFS